MWSDDTYAPEVWREEAAANDRDHEGAAQRRQWAGLSAEVLPARG